MPAIGTALETDAGLPVGPFRVAFGTAIETDAGLPIGPTYTAVGTALETGEARALGAYPNRVLGTALETDGAVRIVPVGQLLGESAQYIFTVEINIPSGEDGEPMTVYASERAMVTTEFDLPASTLLRETLTDPGALRREVSIDPQKPGTVTPSWGRVVLDNSAGQYDAWLDYVLHGALVVCRYGRWRGAFPEEHHEVYRAYVNGPPLVDFATIELEVRGREYLFDKPIVMAQFAGTGGDEGDDTVGTRKRQIVMGECWFRPILISEVDQVYYLSGHRADNEGNIEVYDGGVPLENDGPYTGFDIRPGRFQTKRTSGGEVYVYLGSPPRVEITAKMLGINTDSGLRWTIGDLLTRAGVTFTSQSMDEVFDAGNRVVETQTYAEVLSDIAVANVAAIGMTRLDDVTVRKLWPSLILSTYDVRSSRHIFTQNNSRDWKAVRLGSGQRVGTVKVRSGATEKTNLANSIADGSFSWIDSNGNPVDLTPEEEAEIEEVRSRLNRDGWMKTFTAASPGVVAQDVGAETAEVEIVSDQFATEAAMLVWAETYLQFFGCRPQVFTLRAPFSMAAARLELLDRVGFESDRFGWNERVGRVVSVSLNLAARNVEFVLLSHRERPTDATVETTDESTTVGGSGGGVGILPVNNAPPDGRDFTIPFGDATTPIVVGVSAWTFHLPFDFLLDSVMGSLKTPQTSGSAVQFDVRADGVSILSTVITIDNGESTSLGASTPPAIATTVFVAGTKFSFHVLQVGDGTAIGPSVAFVGRKL